MIPSFIEFHPLFFFFFHFFSRVDSFPQFRFLLERARKVTRPKIAISYRFSFSVLQVVLEVT